ncbi:MAG: CDP-diacylglycerol--glycerol-3-phosphate 3-phosphatidyltransferase [Firmicutes bacterium]|nr:CDP-diacylglycerol--glycerol-3-phosphate 3-phosphatidyltransferase [Bacillota bacterium]
MTYADALSASRIVLAPAIMACFMSPSESWRIIGLVLFIIAGLTDYADGKLARRAGKTTRLGAYLDPLADKVLVLGAGIALAAAGRLSVWIVFVVLIRELAITGLRSVLPANVHMPASLLAKWKTTGQLVALGASAVLTGWLPDGLWAIALALTIWTGIQYFIWHWPQKSSS